MEEIPPRELHGTNAGFQRHKRDGERPCAACAKARREYSQRRNATPEWRRKNRLRARARHMAYQALSREFPDRFRLLYERFLKAVMDADNNSD